MGRGPALGTIKMLGASKRWKIIQLWFCVDGLVGTWQVGRRVRGKEGRKAEGKRNNGGVRTEEGWM